jgi:hypothetical protein
MGGTNMEEEQEDLEETMSMVVITFCATHIG